MFGHALYYVRVVSVIGRIVVRIRDRQWIFVSAVCNRRCIRSVCNRRVRFHIDASFAPVAIGMHLLYFAVLSLGSRLCRHSDGEESQKQDSLKE